MQIKFRILRSLLAKALFELIIYTTLVHDYA
jgi:hypothetical protein